MFMRGLRGNPNWAAIDGRTGGTTRAAGPQYPTAYADYSCVVKPPYAAAGVDYAVGIDDGVVLKDPSSAANWPSGSLPAGFSIDLTNKRIRCDGGLAAGTSVVIENMDFSLNGGFYFYGTGDNVPTYLEFKNCKWGIGINSLMGITLSNCPQTTVLVWKFEVDGGGYNDGGLSWTEWANSGTATLGAYYRTPYEGRIYQCTGAGTFVSGANTEGGLTEPRWDGGGPPSTPTNTTVSTSGTAELTFVRKAQKNAVFQFSGPKVTVRWGLWKDVPYDGMTWSSGDSVLVEFCCYVDGNWMCSGHTDYNQCGGGKTDDSPMVFRFCTVIQGPTRTARGHPSTINTFARIGDFGPLRVTNPQCYAITIFGDSTKTHNGVNNTLVNSSIGNVTQFRGDSNQANKDSTVFAPFYGWIYITGDALGTGYAVISYDSGGPQFTVGPASKMLVDMHTGNVVAYPGPSR